MRIKNIIFIPFFLTGFWISASAQTVVVTDDPSYTIGNASAMLDIKSTTKGVLVPRVTLTALLSNASPVTSPATGLLVYNEGANQPVGFYFWNGSAWTLMGGSSSANGSETIVTASTPISKSGTGTGASPYVITYTTQSVTRAQRDALAPYAWQYVWCSDCATGELQVFNGLMWTNSTGGPRSLAIGEPYQGGKVAYILQPTDFGYVAGEIRGFIAATSDNTSGIGWGCNSVPITGADGTALGAGTQNTTDIITGCGSLGIPARVAFDYSVTENGVIYRDWFLPSSDELNKLYLNRSAIGGFTTSNPTYYYSSSEVSSTLATSINFNNGTLTSSPRAPSPATNYRSRAIRYFTGGRPDIIQVGALFQGGIVAYIFQSGDPGYVAGETHGIIAATSDQSTGVVWGCYGTDLGGYNTAERTAIGGGFDNSMEMLSYSCNGAAEVCIAYSSGGYSGWFLPSKDELLKLYLNRNLIGNFSTSALYWSSSEYHGDEILDAETRKLYSWYVNFSNGNSGLLTKDQNYRVRSIRYF